MRREQTRRDYLRYGTLGVTAAVAGCQGLIPPKNDGNETAGGGPKKVDDWSYNAKKHTGGGLGGGGIFGGVMQGQSAATAGGGGAAQSASGNVGYSVGGAKDVNNFRHNIEEGYTPQPTDISYEGLFYDYYFDTGSSDSCDSLFCPSYSPAITNDPLSDETERYFTVGLNSNLSMDDFERKDLNVVLVIDVSGSMSSGFGQYYYDRFGKKHEIEGDPDKPKIEVAAQALKALTQQLEPGDRFGLVAYNNEAKVAKPLRKVEETDMEAIRGHLEELRAGGGTNLEAGLEKANLMLEDYTDADPTAVENRIITLTDAMPNIGTTDDDELRGKLEANAEKEVYSTFVGVGVDFNTEIIDSITSIEGANYYAVHSPEQFRERMGEQFDFMVTPLVFDLSVELAGDGYEIEKVYGSTAAEDATEQIMYVNTLFPSESADGKTRGGVVLVKVSDVEQTDEIELQASWERRDGTEDSVTKTVSFPEESPDYYANTGIRKAVLLSRYADLMKNWTIETREAAEEREEEPSVEIEDDDETVESGMGNESVGNATGNETVESTEGIEPPRTVELNEWEHQSVDLTVSERYRERFTQFNEHFEAEMNALGDDDLEQESEILEDLASVESGF
jgi:Ca-activated chloride channel family protein